MLRIPNRQNLLPELYRTEFSVQKIPTCEQPSCAWQSGVPPQMKALAGTFSKNGWETPSIFRYCSRIHAQQPFSTYVVLFCIYCNFCTINNVSVFRRFDFYINLFILLATLFVFNITLFIRISYYRRIILD